MCAAAWAAALASEAAQRGHTTHRVCPIAGRRAQASSRLVTPPAPAAPARRQHQSTMLLHRRWPRLAAWAHAAAPRPRPQQHAIPTSVRPASTSAAPPATPLPPRRRARWLLFLPPAAAAYLCTWQIERKAWKEGLMQRWEAAAAAEPVALASLPACAPELTRVVAAGLLDHGRAVLVGPRPRSVAGGTVSG